MMKKYKPTTSSRRGLILVDKSSLYKGGSYKSLTTGMSSSGGRNNSGRTTCRHRGGGNKRLYRLVDFKRNCANPAEVIRFEHDPNRNAFIALVKYENGEHSYILAPQGLKVGEKVVSNSEADIKPGNTLPLKNIPVGTLIHNIELKPGKGGQMVKAAGGKASLIGREGNWAQVRLPSSEVYRVHTSCRATVGILSNPDHSNEKLAKAGRNRWQGIRPGVRGVAMNPVDHPHGGGEGRTSTGRHPVTPWGKGTKGTVTRKANKFTNKFIIRRRGK